MNQKKTIFSGIQPTGNLTIGNYIGAMTNWLALQETDNCMFCLVDLHALTVRNDPAMFAGRCLDFVALYMACGIDPAKSTIFIQSHVPAHSELAWILCCQTPFGDLRRMTQFKEKAAKTPKNINAGLLCYPVLMASDILLYDTDVVPVGEDQKQHLEITRDIAVKFNRDFGEVFTVPEPMIPGRGARIKSLKDPTRKMSKTADDPGTYIALLDPPDVIEEKVKKSVTSSNRGYPIHDDGSGTANLLTIYTSVVGKSAEEAATQYAGVGFSSFKKDLSGAVSSFLEPIRQRFTELRSDEGYLQDVLASGAQRAGSIALATMQEVRRALGIYPAV